MANTTNYRHTYCQGLLFFGSEMLLHAQRCCGDLSALAQLPGGKRQTVHHTYLGGTEASLTS